MNILDHFKLKDEAEYYETVVENVTKSVAFKGTNLWILVFAIFIASLGLNVNSTAVIIGAMLISPLMGPITGLGLGMAINDLLLIKRAFSNYLFAAGVGLLTSTIFFLISPIDEAHSEILARTSPNIYDVLIAVFGGFAGILATSSKQKGNVIPGVAIATALMPPLCTAGYGLATLKLDFFIGALYLFLINTVFIALSTLITARLLHFPLKHLLEKKEETKAKRIVWGVVIITLLPSIYFGYDIVEQGKFKKQATIYIEKEAVFPNDFLLKKTIDPKHRSIVLIYGGECITEKEILLLKGKLKKYKLTDAVLEIRQGFSYLKEDNGKLNQLAVGLDAKENQVHKLKNQLDSINSQTNLTNQIFQELQTQNNAIQSFILQRSIIRQGVLPRSVWISIVKSKHKTSKKERIKIEKWLKVRIHADSLMVQFLF